jgi:hypothetical protein
MSLAMSGSVAKPASSPASLALKTNLVVEMFYSESVLWKDVLLFNGTLKSAFELATFGLALVLDHLSVGE